MAILIRTRDVPAEELRDTLRAVVCDTLGPLDFRSDPGIPLQGEIAAGQLGPVNVGRVETSTPHSVYRTSGRYCPADPGALRRCQPAVDGSGGKAVASAIPGTVHRVLAGQPHYVAPEAIVPELIEFLITA